MTSFITWQSKSGLSCTRWLKIESRELSSCAGLHRHNSLTHNKLELHNNIYAIQGTYTHTCVHNDHVVEK